MHGHMNVKFEYNAFQHPVHIVVLLNQRMFMLSPNYFRNIIKIKKK